MRKFALAVATATLATIAHAGTDNSDWLDRQLSLTDGRTAITFEQSMGRKGAEGRMGEASMHQEDPAQQAHEAFLAKQLSLTDGFASYDYTSR